MLVLLAVSLGVDAAFAQSIDKFVGNELKSVPKDRAFDALKDVGNDLNAHTMEMACENPNSQGCQTAKLSGLALGMIIAVGGAAVIIGTVWKSIEFVLGLDI